MHSAISCHALGQASSNAKHATQPSRETLRQAQSQKGSEPLAIAQCHDPLQLSSTRHMNAPQLSSTWHHQRAATCTQIQSMQISRQEHSKDRAAFVATYGQRAQRQRHPTISPKLESDMWQLLCVCVCVCVCGGGGGGVRVCLCVCEGPLLSAMTRYARRAVGTTGHCTAPYPAMHWDKRAATQNMQRNQASKRCTKHSRKKCRNHLQ